LHYITYINWGLEKYLSGAMFTVIYTIMHSHYYGLKYTNLYRAGNYCNYSNCGPAQIPI